MNEAAEFLRQRIMALPRGLRWTVLVVATLAVAVTLVIAVQNTDGGTDAAPQSEAAQQPAEPVGSFSDGTYRVGQDISPGTYQNSDSSRTCYWKRLSGFSGALDDIITSAIGGSIQIVAVKPSDAGFSANRCGTWQRID